MAVANKHAWSVGVLLSRGGAYGANMAASGAACLSML